MTPATPDSRLEAANDIIFPIRVDLLPAVLLCAPLWLLDKTALAADLLNLTHKNKSLVARDRPQHPQSICEVDTLLLPNRCACALDETFFPLEIANIVYELSNILHVCGGNLNYISGSNEANRTESGSVVLRSSY